jgi:hypothetical protein
MARPRKTPNEVVGRTGTSVFSGILIDPYEYNAKLEGQAGLTIYNQMRRSDGQVSAALLALELPILNAEWQINGPEDMTPEEEKILEYCRWFFFHRMNWTVALQQAVHGRFWAGHAVFEKIVQVDETTGNLYVSELSPRLQQTIAKWNFDESDNLVSIEQQLPFTNRGAARQVVIPAESLIIFNYKQEGSDLRGRSILRCSYKHWWFKQNLEKVAAIGAERGAVGFPYANLPPGGLTTESQQELEAILAAVRTNEQASAIFPDGVEPKNFSIETKIDSNVMPQLNYHNEMISRSIMAQFLDLGTTETGARALGESFMNLFLKGLAGEAEQVRNVFQKQVLNTVIEFNWTLDEDRYPQLTVSGIELEDVLGLSDVLQKIKPYLTPTEKTEKYIRKTVGLPELDPGEYKEPSSPAPGSSPPASGPAPKPGEKPEEEKTKTFKMVAPLKTDEEWAFWRPLNVYETCMALREIIGKEDDAVVGLVKEVDAARKTVVEDLREQALAAFRERDLNAALKINLNQNLVKALASIMLDNLDALYQYGRQTVRDEMASQRKTIRPKVPQVAMKFPGLTPGDEEVLYEWLTVLTLQKSDAALAPVAARIRENVLSAIRNNAGTIDDLLSGAEDFSRQRVEKSVQELVHESFSQGRAAGAEEVKNEVRYCIYSAIMDTGTCGPCSQADGEEVMLDSAEYTKLMPPNQECEGGDMCRCVWIYVFEEGAE